MIIKKPWYVEFNDYGGYDCMWSAHEIIDSAGDTVLTVDYHKVRDGKVNDKHGENLEDKALAEYICKLVNTHE